MILDLMNLKMLKLKIFICIFLLIVSAFSLTDCKNLEQKDHNVPDKRVYRYHNNHVVEIITKPTTRSINKIYHKSYHLPAWMYRLG